MSTQSTYIGIEPRSMLCGAVAIARGLRATRTAGVLGLSPIGARGDFVAMTDIEALKPGQVASMEGAGKVPAVASVAVAVDDPAYSAANGQWSNNAAGAILCGRWTQAASGAGVLGEVELMNPL